MRKLSLPAVAMLAVALLLSGCAYTHVKAPMDLDLDKTTLGTKTGTASTYSVLWLVAWGDGARETYPGSDFLMTLMEGRPVPEGIDAVTIRTPLDLHILPPESALIPGIRDLQVCCPTHAGLLEDGGVFRVIEGFLRPEEGAAP